MYTVIKPFIDGKDGKGYNIGDIYKGDRIEEFSSNDNRLGEPVIKFKKDEKEKETSKGLFK